MMEDKQQNDQSDLVSILDQLEVHSANMANIMSTYYHSLIKNGLPYDLVKTLVIDLNSLLWSNNGKGIQK